MSRGRGGREGGGGVGEGVYSNDRREEEIFSAEKKKKELKHSLKSAKSISGATGRWERDAMGFNRCAVDV